jgi:hypothetical protein
MRQDEFMLSDITKEKFLGIERKNGISIIGKVVGLRCFNSRSSKTSVRNICHLVLTDHRGTIMQVVFMNAYPPNASSLVGKVTKIGPVSIRERDPMYDGSPNVFTAYARTMGQYTTTCTILDLASSSSFSSGLSVNETQEAARMREIVSLIAGAAYSPLETLLSDVKIDECVNLAAVMIKETVVESTSGDVCLEVFDNTGRALVRIERNDDPRDVFRLDGEKIRNTVPGDILLLMDFIGSVVPFERNGKTDVRLGLKSYGSSRVHVGTKNAAIRDRLHSCLKEEKEEETDKADSRMRYDEIERRMINVSDLNNIVGGKTVTACGIVEEVRPAFMHLTRLKCPNDYKHNDFEEAVSFELENVESGDTSASFCRMCGPFKGKAERMFDVKTLFRERSTTGGENVLLKWSSPCVASCLFRDFSPREVAAAESGCDDKRVSTILAECGGGRPVVMRVWCKTDGTKLVMDATLLSEKIELSDDRALSSYMTNGDEETNKITRMNSVADDNNVTLLDL